MNRQEILTYIYHSPYIKTTLTSILGQSVGKNKYAHYIDDARSHFYLEVCKVSEDKLMAIYNERGLQGIEFYCAGIINHQFTKTTCSFYREFRRTHFEQLPDNIADIPDEIDTDGELEEWRKQWSKEQIKRIKEILDHLPKELGNHCRIAFELYYFHNLTYQRIEELTSVNFQTVRLYVIKTLEHIKQELKKVPKSDI